MTTLFDVDNMPHLATPREKFEAFHQANPKVYEELEALAGEMVTRGRKRIGIGMLFEVLRWNYYLATTDPDSDFKLNNNNRAFYARLLMDNHPDWQGLFETRVIHEKPGFIVRSRS
jgi:hypothetical protein